SLSLRKTKTRTKGAAMKIIGCDFHPSFQQIAMVDTETGEYTERRLTPEEARQFYAELKGPVLVGMEACGNTLWFERLLASLDIDLRLDDNPKVARPKSCHFVSYLTLWYKTPTSPRLPAGLPL